MNPLIGLLPKVIPLKLFLDIVPSSPADITRALRGFFRGGSVCRSFHSKGKQPNGQQRNVQTNERKANKRPNTS